MTRPLVVAWMVLVSAATFVHGTAYAGDASAGRVFFEQLCVVCHTARADDNGGRQGPSLIGLFGRPAASDPEFSYTQQLRDAKLIWDAATLDRFLAAPEQVVPGTAMGIPVPGQADRDNLIAYLQSLVTQPARTAAVVQGDGSARRQALIHAPPN